MQRIESSSSIDGCEADCAGAAAKDELVPEAASYLVVSDRDVVSHATESDATIVKLENEILHKASTEEIQGLVRCSTDAKPSTAVPQDRGQLIASVRCAVRAAGKLLVA